MSFRIRDIQAIHNNPLNTSISKQQYSIPKAERFRNIKSQLSYKYYELPSTNSHKAPSFGVSSRPSPFSVDKQIPPPNKYILKDFLIQKKQITFSRGREQCKTNNFLKTNDNPGPGTYNPNPEFIQQGLCKKYSFRAKTEYNNYINDIPGPGKYTIKQPWLQKQKVLSIDKKHGVPLMREGNNGSKIKTELSQSKIPYYNATKNSKGYQTFNKTGGFSIGKSHRFANKMRTEVEVPGPGYYSRFSEFI